MQQWESERDFVAQYVLMRMKEAAGLLGVSDIMDFHVEAKVGGGTADLIALKAGKRLFVLEAKFKKRSGRVERDIEPRDPEVIRQAINYAVHGGFPYYLTCNTKRIILFQLQPGKKPFESEISSYEFEGDDAWAENILKAVLGQTPVRLKELDDTLIDTLHEAFNDLYPEFLSALKERLKDDEFSKRYEEWLESQGLRPGDETNRLIAEQSTYLHINKLLFYQVIRVIYPDRLAPLSIGEDEDLQEALTRFYEQARKIDYASVYESDVISEIPLTPRAKERFRTLIDTLNQFDFSSMKSDFLGRVYEKLIPPEERKRLGQFYTPPAIAELITLLTIQNKDDLVLDPGCGSGTFLVKAYHRLKELKGLKDVSGPLFGKYHEEILSQLYGVDINQFPAHLSVINLSVQNPAVKVDRINVVVSDFFNIEAGQETLTGFESMTTSGEKTAIKIPHRFDVVVANPPYIRQELLGSKEKDKIKRRIEKDFYGKVYVGQKPPGKGGNVIVLDKQSDVYIYFFLHGLSMLREGGRLGFITSNKWLEVGYGEPFQEFLLKNTKIKYVIEFDGAMFPDAEVETAITILEREADGWVRNDNNVKFVRLKQKMSNDEVVKLLTTVKESYEDERVRINVVKQGSLAPGKWSIYLRAPPVYQRIANHPKMRPLGEIAKVFVGIITGYNDYFILDEEEAKEWGIEKEFLVPCVSSPKKVKGLIIRPEDVKEYCFMV
ncbi:MAG: N-6 DNA methylase, partial [Conexivisphaera sp.]